MEETLDGRGRRKNRWTKKIARNFAALLLGIDIYTIISSKLETATRKKKQLQNINANHHVHYMGERREKMVSCKNSLKKYKSRFSNKKC
jgi:hypothetical protein